MGNNITQTHSGSGDNVAGDKVAGDKVMGDKITGHKIMGDLNISHEHQEIVQEVKAIIIEAADSYNLSSEKGQQKATQEVLEELDAKPTLKQRFMGALKGGGETAIKRLLNHPVADVVVDSVKGFQKGA
ncbi:MAG: hypothetical protein AAGF75_02890 [Cyanobacteria bacterium P01_H01_bin.130]